MPDHRVLVTGATGFLGHHLVNALCEAGYQVRALVRETSDTTHLRDLDVELVIGDVLDERSVQDAVGGCRSVVHAAGLFRFWGRPEDFERANVEGTAYVMQAAQRHNLERFIYISTIAVVGRPPSNGLIDEATLCYPADAYQRSKLLAEKSVQMFARVANLPAIILRPGAYYGPWGRYAFNRLFFEDPLRGLRIQVHHGEHFIFPVFVPDVAWAVTAALSQGRVGETYNICGESITHRKANAIISRLAGISAWRANVPAAWMLLLARSWTRMAERTGREPYYPLNLASYVFNDWRVSFAKAHVELGFTPTPFEDGARQTLEWYWGEQILKRPGRAPRPSSSAGSVAADHA